MCVTGTALLGSVYVVSSPGKWAAEEETEPKKQSKEKGSPKVLPQTRDEARKPPCLAHSFGGDDGKATQIRHEMMQNYAKL